MPLCGGRRETREKSDTLSKNIRKAARKARPMTDVFGPLIFRTRLKWLTLPCLSRKGVHYNMHMRLPTAARRIGIRMIIHYQKT